ncbi:MAG: hypothetical protein JWM02_3417 [Frankiales bacterium]|nr:hypothetical protein [Frankiales bacterium]
MDRPTAPLGVFLASPYRLEVVTRRRVTTATRHPDDHASVRRSVGDVDENLPDGRAFDRVVRFAGFLEAVVVQR